MSIDERLQVFNAMRGALLDEMDDIDPDALVAKPLAGKWSMLEIIWDENQDWLRSCVDRLGPGDLQRAICLHPIAGPLTVEQAVSMGQVHLVGHIRQIRVLQRLTPRS